MGKIACWLFDFHDYENIELCRSEKYEFISNTLYMAMRCKHCGDICFKPIGDTLDDSIKTKSQFYKELLNKQDK
ncbi:MAG: hypothetical protein ACRCXT_22720 [Paraclostridium sp.]